MPSLCSSRSSFMPGLSRSTTNDLIAARPWSGRASPRRRSASARSPEVTKIFSPLRTYSSPSSSAVVRIAAESEPASGSVIAIAAHLPPKRSSCSSFATEAIAELPRPWRGIESSRPTSPQHISMMPSTVERLEPLRFPPSSPSRTRGARRRRRRRRCRSPRSCRRSARRACRAPSGTRARRGRTCARSAGRPRSRPGGPGSTSGLNFFGISRLIIVLSLSAS